MRHLLVWMPLIVMALFMALFGGALVKEAPEPTSPMIGLALPEMTLHALEETDPITIPAFHLGKPYLINLFASWCQPCLAEHPFMTQLSESGIPILGIAWKDTPAESQEFLALHGNPYQFTAQDPHGKAAVGLGISGVPESFLIDAEGMIRGHWKGPITQEWAEQEVLPLWKEINAAPAP